MNAKKEAKNKTKKKRKRKEGKCREVFKSIDSLYKEKNKQKKNK